MEQLTDRQLHEIEYHRQRASQHAHLLDAPFSYDVVHAQKRKWWNAYWEMYSFLLRFNPVEKKALVVGCGFGEDALRLARMGASVYAFDLSRESLELARALARRENLVIQFDEMPAEDLEYEENSFDLVIARDILHHVDVAKALDEVARVSKPGAMLVVNEIYSHSSTEAIRRSRLVEDLVYSKLQNFVYDRQSPYITEDERKLDEKEIRLIKRSINPIELESYFNFLVNRIFPDKYEFLNQFDKLLLIGLSGIAGLLGGRALIAGRLMK